VSHAQSERIEALTERVRPPIVREVELYLATPRCAIWSWRAEDLERPPDGGPPLPEPFWAFAWPGGQAIARYVLDRPDLCRGRHVLDFGAGSGLCAIAAALAGARTVDAVDVDPLAATAIRLNAALNGVEGRVRAIVADPIDTDAGWDLVLAGDMTYDAPATRRAMPWLRSLAHRGATVLLADPGRGFADETALERLAELRAPADVDPGGQHYVWTRVYRVLG
jgi:predicted nicotinamide N-methyase